MEKNSYNEGKIKVIFVKDPACKLSDLKRKKFLLNDKMDYNGLILILRKNLNLTGGEALFIFAKKQYILTQMKSISEIYELYKEQDGILYIYYSCTEVWG